MKSNSTKKVIRPIRYILYNVDHIIWSILDELNQTFLICETKIVIIVSAEFESSNGTLEKKDEIILNSGNDEPIGDGMSTILRRPRDQQQPMTNGSTSQKWDIEVHSNPVVDEQVIK